MKLLFLVRSLHVGGAERQLVTLANGLAEHGHKISIAIFYRDGFFEKSLKGVDIIDLKKTSRYDFASFFFRLVSVVRQQKPDILHAYMPEANIFSILIKPFIPSVKIVWGIRSSNMSLEHYDYLSRIVFKVQACISCFADLIVLNSHAGRAFYQKCGFPPSKMTVVSNGIDTKYFCPDVSYRKKMRKELGIDVNIPVVGVVARLDPMKDHANLIQAAALVLKSMPSTLFVCVGNGTEDYKRILRAEVEKRGLVDSFVWIDNRKHMEQVYNGFDVLCSSSAFGEGFSNVLGEAMACGVPCVVTDVGDSSFIVGNTGKVVSPGNSSQLAANVLDMLKEKRSASSMEDRTRSRIQNNFSIELLINRTTAILQDID